MKKVKIITDSCADLSAEQLEKYNIDYLRMSTVEDGVESPAFLTWTAEEAHKLYDTIRGGKRITTTQVPVEEFNRVFTKYLSEDYDIVYIGCSLKQSGSVNTGTVTARKLLEDYPESKIFCIDSLNASMGEGMVVIEAAKMAEEGMSAEEINAAILPMRNNVRQFVTVSTLDHLKKAGRLSASSAFFGNLVGVKPIIISDAEGAQVAVKKVKGRQNALREIVYLLKECIVDGENSTVYIAHADCSEEELDTVIEAIRSEIGCKEVSVGFIGPIVGASVGPDSIGIWAFGETVTLNAQA